MERICAHCGPKLSYPSISSLISSELHGLRLRLGAGAGSSAAASFLSAVALAGGESASSSSSRTRFLFNYLVDQRRVASSGATWAVDLRGSFASLVQGRRLEMEEEWKDRRREHPTQLRWTCHETPANSCPIATKILSGTRFF